MTNVQAQKPDIREPSIERDEFSQFDKLDATPRECPHPHNPNAHGGLSFQETGYTKDCLRCDWLKSVAPPKPIGEFHMELTNSICELEIERDALKARVAELEATHFTCPECSEVVMNRTSAKIIDELAAANETIKALRHEMRMQGSAVRERDAAEAEIANGNTLLADAKAEIERLTKVLRVQDNGTLKEQLTQANARIAEQYQLICEQDFREQKLVAALERIIGMCTYDGKVINKHGIPAIVMCAQSALKANKGEV